MHKPTNLEINPALAGYYAQPDGHGPFPAVLLFMEAFGITDYIQRTCQGLAQKGFVTLAPDFFHGEVFAYTDMDSVMAKLPTLQDDQLMQETAASLVWLAAQNNVDPSRVGVIGFCMGGRLAFMANCRFPERLKAAVGFYGSGIAPEGATDRFGRPAPLNDAGKMRAPIFLGYGADDTGITPAEHARVAEKLSRLKKRYTLAVYPGAGHGFLCDERTSHAPAAAAIAWPQALAFLRAELGTSAG